MAAYVGNGVEWYDFAVFGAAAAALSQALTPGSLQGFATVFAVFATSCLFRPLGSLVLGSRADRFGRQRILVVTILAMALATFAIGLLPPWSAIGVLAPLLLLVFRAVQAFSAGGEIGVAIAYLIDVSAPQRRGRTGGWYLATVAIGLAAGLAVTAAVAAATTPEQHQTWAWRVPFLLALPLGVVGLYIRLRGPGAASPPVHARAPFRTTLRLCGPSVRRCFVLGAAYGAAFNVWFVFLPSYLAATGTSSLIGSLTAAMAGLLVGAVVAPLVGHWSDRIGRRRVLIGATTALLVVSLPSFQLLRGGGGVGMMAGSVAMGAVLGAFPLPAFLAEQFPAPIRSTGIGVSYGISSAVIGGTAPLLATLFAQHVSLTAIPLYVMGWSVLAVLAVLRRPRDLVSDQSDGPLGSPCTGEESEWVGTW